MDERGITIEPYRIIPCDVGHELTPALKSTLVERLQRDDGWTLGDVSDSTDGKALLEATIAVDDPDRSLHVQLFWDGIAVFTLIDPPDTVSDYREYDPESTLRARNDAHDAILDHDHAISASLQEAIATLREPFDPEAARFSAAPEWERGGLSYVFSFYFIDADIELVHEPAFQDKLVYLIFAEEAKRGLEYAERADVSRDVIQSKLRERFLDVINQDYDPIPHIHTCASWSNLLIIGAVDTEVVETYWALERGLQHTWFYTYVTDQFIDRSLEHISTDTPKQRLEELDSRLNNMMYNINQYRGISESTLSERDFQLYQALVETSRLESMTENVEEKAELLRDRYTWLLEEKRTRVDYRIDFVLFVIFIATLVGQYETFLELGLWTLPLLGLILVVGLYLYIPYFRERYEGR